MEFIPGDQYRLDIIGADSTIIVDSWTGQVRADIVGHNGELIVDVAANKVYGPLVGNVETLAGETILDTENKQFTGVLYGDVYNSENEIVLDADNNTLYANVNGNIVDEFNEAIIDVANRSVIADSFSGDFFGNFYGTLSSDSEIYGSLEGDFNGNGYGSFSGNFNGNFDGEFTGIHIGRTIGDVTGSLIGQLLYDENTPMTAIDDINNKSAWLGSIAWTGASGSDIILNSGPERHDVYIKANVVDYEGNVVIDLGRPGESSPVFKGRLQGDITDANGKSVLQKSGDDWIIGNQANISVGSYEDLRTLKFFNKQIRHYTKQTSALSDYIFHSTSVDAEGNPGNINLSQKTLRIESTATYDDSDKKIGYIEFGVDQSKPINNTSPFLPGEFSIKMFDGAFGPDLSKKFSVNGDGVASANVFRAMPTDFVTRDSMAAQEGMIIFNTNTKKFQGFTGSNWVDLH